MELKSKSGKKAILFQQKLGSLIEGDGIVALADNAWFKTNSILDPGTALPLGVGYKFKSPD